MGSKRTTADEDALVRIDRAFHAYVAERTRFDPTLEVPRGPEELWIETFADGSGRLQVCPDNGGTSRGRTVCWWEAATAGAAKIEVETILLETARKERATDARGAFGRQAGRLTPQRRQQLRRTLRRSR